MMNDLLRAAQQARAFAQTHLSPEDQFGFLELAARWEAQAAQEQRTAEPGRVAHAKQASAGLGESK